MFIKKQRNCITNLQPILTLCCIFGVCTLNKRLKFSWWKCGFCTIAIIFGFVHLLAIPSVLEHKEKFNVSGGKVGAEGV